MECNEIRFRCIVKSFSKKNLTGIKRNHSSTIYTNWEGLFEEEACIGVAAIGKE